MKKGSLLVIFFFFINASILRGSNEILLKSRRFVPELGVSTADKEAIEAVPGKSHVLIQLKHIPTIKEKKELDDKGIKLLSYIPNKAWFASIPSDKVNQTASLSNVRSICELLPEDKISPTIRDGVDTININADGTVNLAVVFFGDVSLSNAAKSVSDYGGKVYGRAPLVNTLLITISNQKILDLKSEEKVKWITGASNVPKEFNDGSRAAIHVEEIQDTPYNLTGTGVVVGQWDSGWVDTTHHDLAGRVTIGDASHCGSYPDSGSCSTVYHATHVAGTMLGNGCRSQAEGGTHLQWRGMATNATVISYEWWDDIYELEREYNSAINTFGIDISTNSWGFHSCSLLGDYQLECKALDKIVIGSLDKRIPIVWSAGNERLTNWPWCGYYGHVYNTIPPYGTAKNVITVGATYSDTDGMTCFSSWGPVNDGRVKPDVVAPGDKTPCEGYGIKSTVPGNTYNDLGFYGTSMAAPAVSGTVALMLEDWRDNHSNEPDPLPSTIKAILVHTAKDLGNTGPDYSHGYGLIDAQDAIDLIREDTSDNVILENSLSGPEDIDTITIDVPQGQTELKITLVWDDYPGDPASSEALVNDLDLIVKAPDQTRHYPWTLDPSNPEDPAVRTQEDHLNNVEQVWVEDPASGTWTIEISETEIPEPEQFYSLVSNIKFGPTPPFTYDGSFSGELGTPVEITLMAVDDGLPDPPGAMAYIVTSLPSNGTLSDPGAGQISSVPYTLTNNGNKVIFLPNLVGSDNFTFKANDDGMPPSGGDSEEGMINVYVIGLENWWRLDEMVGAVAYDSIGDNDGDVYGATWTDGKIGGALQFDGTNDYVLLDPSDSLKGDSVTISAWIKGYAIEPYTVEHHYHPVVSTYYFESPFGYGYLLYVKDDEPRFYIASGSSECAVGVGNIDNDWHHIAGTFDGSYLKIYVDGEDNTSPDLSGYNFTGFYEEYNNTYIGYEDEFKGDPSPYKEDIYFDGKIDDVRVYNYALSEFEIWDLMSGDSSRFRIKSSSDETVAWFDDLGNLFLKGEELELPGINISGALIVKNSEDHPVAYIDDQGNLYIEGVRSQGGCNPPANSFKIKNSSGTTVSYIDSDGNLCLSGNLYENPS